MTFFYAKKSKTANKTEFKAKSTPIRDIILNEQKEHRQNESNKNVYTKSSSSLVMTKMWYLSKNHTQTHWLNLNENGLCMRRVLNKIEF